MHYPHKPHFKIFTTAILGFLQYFLLNYNIDFTHDEGKNEMIYFGILTLNSLVISVVSGSAVYSIRNQIKAKITDEVTLLQKELRLAEDQIEKFEHVILDEATLLLGSKVYRTNPILNQFE
jgi:hypothetical protein